MSAAPTGFCYAQATPKLEIAAPGVVRSEEVLAPLALQLLASLHRRFDSRRLQLLGARQRCQAQFDAGVLPELVQAPPALTAVGSVSTDWQLSPTPPQLQHRRLQIVAPGPRKTLINALNVPDSVVLADFEDSCSPTWNNIIGGQVNLLDAVRGAISFSDPNNGKVYRLAPRTAALAVRPRGWHLPEKHVRIGGEPVSGALFDFALYVANNHAVLARQGTAPFFYLPKIESHLEARLWNEVFIAAQDALGLARGTIRAVILIETLPAAFAADAITAELREHCAGLAGDPGDYIFSFIKTFRNQAQRTLPDRTALTMDRHFLRSYIDVLTGTCQRRGAQPLDSLKGAAQPARGDANIRVSDLLHVPAGEITEAGLRSAISLGIQYLESWLRGEGRLAFNSRVEDVATAEICRVQLWHWIHHGARTADGRIVTAEHFDHLLTQELDRIHREVGTARLAGGVFPTAARLFAATIKRETCDEFLTLSAYEYLT